MTTQAFNFDEIAEVFRLDRNTLPSNETIAPPPPNRAPRVNVQPLSDLEWEIVSAAMPPLPVPRPNGFRDREFLDAILWHRVAKDQGFGWSALPAYFPPRMTVQHRSHRWAVAGTWEDIARRLEGDERLSAERRHSFQRIAADAAQKRTRVLSIRSRLNESL